MYKKRMATLMVISIAFASSVGNFMAQPADAKKLKVPDAPTDPAAVAAAKESEKDSKSAKTEDTLLHVTDATFKKEVLKSSKPVLVDFYADWCGPCQLMAPVLEEVSKDLGKKIKVVKMNSDENQKTALAYDVTNIPIFILYKKGKVVEKVLGMQEKKKLVSAIKKHL